MRDLHFYFAMNSVTNLLTLHEYQSSYLYYSHIRSRDRAIYCSYEKLHSLDLRVKLLELLLLRYYLLLVVLVLACSSQPSEIASMPLEICFHWGTRTAVYTCKEVVDLVR